MNIEKVIKYNFMLMYAYQHTSNKCVCCVGCKYFQYYSNRAGDR